MAIKCSDCGIEIEGLVIQATGTSIDVLCKTCTINQKYK
jgi:NMD protein affecting ribosome stability and mRNA decay